MRGDHSEPESVFSYITPAQRVNFKGCFSAPC